MSYRYVRIHVINRVYCQSRFSDRLSLPPEGMGIVLLRAHASVEFCGSVGWRPIGAYAQATRNTPESCSCLTWSSRALHARLYVWLNNRTDAATSKQGACCAFFEHNCVWWIFSHPELAGQASGTLRLIVAVDRTSVCTSDASELCKVV